MSNLERGNYPRHQVIYHTDAGTIPRAINANNISILEAVPDDAYVPLIKYVSFILDKLKNANQQTLIELYDREFLYGSSSKDADFETKIKCAPKFIKKKIRATVQLLLKTLQITLSPSH